MSVSFLHTVRPDAKVHRKRLDRIDEIRRVESSARKSRKSGKAFRRSRFPVLTVSRVPAVPYGRGGPTLMTSRESQQSFTQSTNRECLYGRVCGGGGTREKFYPTSFSPPLVNAFSFRNRDASVQLIAKLFRTRRKPRGVMDNRCGSVFRASHLTFFDSFSRRPFVSSSDQMTPFRRVVHDASPAAPSPARTRVTARYYGQMSGIIDHTRTHNARIIRIGSKFHSPRLWSRDRRVAKSARK